MLSDFKFCIPQKVEIEIASYAVFHLSTAMILKT